MKKLKSIVFVGALALCFLVSMPGQAMEGKVRAASFTLEDQFDNRYALAFPSEKPTALIFIQRADSVVNQAKKWQLAFQSGKAKNIDVRMVVPIDTSLGLVKWIIKGHMKKQQPFWLDWESKVAAQYGYEPSKKQAKVVLIGKDGAVLKTVDGAFSPAAYEEMIKTLGI